MDYGDVASPRPRPLGHASPLGAMMRTPLWGEGPSPRGGGQGGGHIATLHAMLGRLAAAQAQLEASVAALPARLAQQLQAGRGEEPHAPSAPESSALGVPSASP